jgi:hypothetical protein
LQPAARHPPPDPSSAAVLAWSVLAGAALQSAPLRSTMSLYPSADAHQEMDLDSPSLEEYMQSIGLLLRESDRARQASFDARKSDFLTTMYMKPEIQQLRIGNRKHLGTPVDLVCLLLAGDTVLMLRRCQSQGDRSTLLDTISQLEERLSAREEWIRSLETNNSQQLKNIRQLQANVSELRDRCNQQVVSDICCS